MIASVIRQLCALSVLCGAAMSVTPEGTVKRVMEIVCSTVLMTALLQPIIGFDFAAYALELAKFEERKTEFLEESGELNDKLNRLVIERKYETYIMDKARELGAGQCQAEVTVQWSEDGYWLPYAVWIDCGADYDHSALSGHIEAALGIPVQRQQWSYHGTREE